MKALKRLITKSLVLIILIIANPASTLFATHIAGTELTYNHAGGNDYRVTYTLYRDCAGTTAPLAANLLVKSTTCNQFLQFSLPRSSQSGNQIGNVCSNATTCNGGSTPGVRAYIYTGLITLPMNCTDWKLSVSDCCRNASVTNLSHPEAQGVYTEALLNNLNGRNNSPFFTIEPVYFLCSNQKVHLNPGVMEPDGDSLVYSLTPALTGEDVSVNYAYGFDALHPLTSAWPVSMDQATGDLECIPTGQEIDVIHYTIKEYRNGILIGSVMHDMQLYIQNCQNTLPELSGVNGSNEFVIHTCADRTLNFFVIGKDLQTDQQLTISYQSEISNAGFIQSLTERKAYFSWLPGINDVRDQPYLIHLSVKDNACPVSGFQTYTYQVYVHAPFTVTAVVTAETCPGKSDGSILFHTSGTDQPLITWTEGSSVGESITGLAAGNFPMKITGNAGCSLDTLVVIGTLYRPSISVTSVNQPTCSHSSNGMITVLMTGGNPNVHYDWSDGQSGSSLDQLSPGNYEVLATDQNGCTASEAIELTPQYSVQEPVISGDSMLCSDHSIQITSSPAEFYEWSNGATSPSIEIHQSGSYSLTITDKNGCKASSSIAIHEGHCTTVDLQINVRQLTGTLSISASHFSNPVSFRIVNMAGQVVGEYNEQVAGEEITIGPLSSGIYLIEATSGSERTSVKVMCSTF